MEEPIGRYYILNGAAKPIESVGTDIDACGKSLYEVVRVIDRTPLFIEEHIARLRRSARLAGRRLAIPAAEIKRLLSLLVEINDISSSNIRMVYRDDADPAKEVFLVYFMKSRYPDETLYRDGINVGLLEGERRNPTVKRDGTAVRKAADTVLKEGVFYEMLLVNAEGFVTEGSRSNVYFISEGRLYTPPDRDVLAGVTKRKLIEICKREGIGLCRRRVHRQELAAFEVAFLSGTPLKVIPIRSIDNNSFRTDHPLLRSLMRWYDLYIQEYISKYRPTT